MVNCRMFRPTIRTAGIRVASTIWTRVYRRPAFRKRGENFTWFKAEAPPSRRAGLPAPAEAQASRVGRTERAQRSLRPCERAKPARRSRHGP